MSVVVNEASSWAKGAHVFADRVAERTGGRIKITVYPNATLAGGNQGKELEMLRSGDVDFTYHSNLLYSGLDQAFAAISLPWLFADAAQIDKALAGPAGRQLLDVAQSKGIRGLAWGENGFRQITNSKTAIRRPEDLQGLKIRIPDAQLYRDIFGGFGAAPAVMNFGEVYAALQSGKIDGQENPIDIIASAKLYEVQKHITLWNYSYDALILGMNQKDWDGLPAAGREIVQQAAVEASQAQIKLNREATQAQVALLKEKGMAVTELTAAEVDGFRGKMTALYAEWTARLGAELVEALRK